MDEGKSPNLMDPNQLNNETMPEVVEQNLTAQIEEQVEKILDFNYDMFGSWEDEWDNSQGDIILFI